MAYPCIKWVGGKRQLLPELVKHLPETLPGIYLEPFIGGGALFFHLHGVGRLTAGVHLNDSNPDLVNVYLSLRDEPETVIGHLHQLQDERRIFDATGRKAHYLEQHSRFNHSGNDAMKAARFIYLNRFGFNGLCRYNAAGGFNVPAGKFAIEPGLDFDNLRAVSAALQGVQITCNDFESAIAGAVAGATVYCDPPYIPLDTTSSFTSYTDKGFDGRDQVRLRDMAVGLSHKGVTVILSNSDSPVVRELYGTGGLFELHPIQARRAINCDASKRGTVGELIIVARGKQ